MVSETRRRRIYWPKSGLTREKGMVVGWTVEDTMVVVGIVEEWVSEFPRESQLTLA
jgi:hypothetical protein